jgi:hypothetical protein
MGGEVELEEAARAFRRWRQGRRASGGRIPDELWAQAARVANVHGITRTAERLGLNGTRLKERCEIEARGRGFVELAASELPMTSEHVVEIESAEGSRLRLVLRGASVAAVTAAAKELWSVAR